MLKVDYAQLEARVIAMTSRDKTLVKQTKEKYDIHGDWTVRIGKKAGQDEAVAGAATRDKPYKAYRDKIKNGWTFPLLFGSSLKSVAGNLSLDPALIREDYNEFWKQYPEVKQWQEGLAEFYRENHYVETLTGFRRWAPLTWNELINQPVQGTASDIVIDGMSRLAVMAYSEKRPELFPRLNVHDELDFYLPDDSDLDRNIYTIAREMACCQYKFINVPLAVEVSIGPDWYQQEEVGVFESTEFEEEEAQA